MEPLSAGEWEKLKKFFLTKGYSGFDAWVTPGETYEEYLAVVERWRADAEASKLLQQRSHGPACERVAKRRHAPRA